MNNTSFAAAQNQALTVRQKALGLLALASALGLGLWLYSQPDIVIMLSEQLWSCF